MNAGQTETPGRTAKFQSCRKISSLRKIQQLEAAFFFREKLFSLKNQGV
jgi:hypothetical protein